MKHSILLAALLAVSTSFAAVPAAPASAPKAKMTQKRHAASAHTLARAEHLKNARPSAVVPRAPAKAASK